MKKILSILLAFILLFSMTACAPTSEELEAEQSAEFKILYEKYESQLTDLFENGKNYREYSIWQPEGSEYFYCGFSDVNDSMMRSFSYDKESTTFRTTPIGFGDTVDENGIKCFSSIDAVLDLGLFTMEVRNSYNYFFGKTKDSLVDYNWVSFDDNYVKDLPEVELHTNYFTPTTGVNSENHVYVEKVEEDIIITKSYSDLYKTTSYTIYTYFDKIPAFTIEDVAPDGLQIGWSWGDHCCYFNDRYTIESQGKPALTDANIDTETVKIIPPAK